MYKIAAAQLRHEKIKLNSQHIDTKYISLLTSNSGNNLVISKFNYVLN